MILEEGPFSPVSDMSTVSSPTVTGPGGAGGSKGRVSLPSQQARYNVYNDEQPRPRETANSYRPEVPTKGGCNDVSKSG